MDAHLKAFVVVGVPAREYREQRVQQAVGGRGTLHPIVLPPLRVGTLDSLLTLSDELQRLDLSVTSAVSKVARTALELKAGTGLPQVEVHPGQYVSPEAYLQYFEWSENFPQRQKLSVLVESIVKDVSEVEDRLRTDLSAVANVRSELQGIQRRETGSLQSRSLMGIIGKEDILDSESLVPLFVFVPSHLKKTFEQKYEHFGRENNGKCWVVPRSARVVAEDTEGSLFRIFCFGFMVDHIKKEIRELKMVPRELSQEDTDAGGQGEHRRDLQDSFENMTRDLEASLPGAFSQAFSCWVHLKMIRVFVDSVLRYGLPPDFSFFMVRCDRKNERKIRQELLKLFQHLGSAGFQSSDLDHAEYLPFVCNVLALS